jgi:hypothetical protein
MGAFYYKKIFNKKNFRKEWKEYIEKEKKRIINDFGKTYYQKVNCNIIRKNRNSPSESATCFNEGSTKKGIDNNWYIVKKKINNNKFWKKISFNDVLDFAMYNRSPVSWDFFKLNKSYIKDDIENIDEFIQNIHKKWTPGLIISYKNKYIVGGWVSE